MGRGVAEGGGQALSPIRLPAVGHVAARAAREAGGASRVTIHADHTEPRKRRHTRTQPEGRQVFSSVFSRISRVSRFVPPEALPSGNLPDPFLAVQTGLRVHAFDGPLSHTPSTFPTGRLPSPHVPTSRRCLAPSRPAIRRPPMSCCRWCTRNSASSPPAKRCLTKTGASKRSSSTSRFRSRPPGVPAARHRRHGRHPMRRVACPAGVGPEGGDYAAVAFEVARSLRRCAMLLKNS